MFFDQITSNNPPSSFFFFTVLCLWVHHDKHLSVFLETCPDEACLVTNYFDSGVVNVWPFPLLIFCTCTLDIYYNILYWMSNPLCYFTSGLCPGLAIGQHIAEGRRQCTGESPSAAQVSMRMERSVHVSIFKNQYAHTHLHKHTEMLYKDSIA